MEFIKNYCYDFTQLENVTHAVKSNHFNFSNSYPKFTATLSIIDADILGLNFVALKSFTQATT